MELVHGVPITKYCDDNHLTPRQRLELFVPVCQAIQHAHQKGIIHRDIKPSNVMVTLYDGKPVPKVIDFGVAKATEQKLTERTLFTQYGTMVGTLEYMSPEQAEMSALGVDTRSDIYSLGVLLYELLTGSTPLTHKRLQGGGVWRDSPHDQGGRAAQAEHAALRLGRGAGVDLGQSPHGAGQADEAGARRAGLDRDEDAWRRTATAATRRPTASPPDVQRYLADEPVQACPPSAGYRFRKFARRNKRTLATAALFGVMLLAAVGAVTGTVGWAVRDREAREQELARKAERDLALTEQGVRQAVEQAAKIRGELHAVLTKPGGVQELLNQPGRWNFLIQSAQSELAQARRSTARAETRLSAELTQALHKLEEQLSGDEADRLLALRLEKIRLDRATWVEGRFDYRKAAAEYPQAFAGFAVLKEDAAAVAARLRSSPIKEQLVAALDDWALVAFWLRNEPLAEQLLAVARQAAPDPAWGRSAAAAQSLARPGSPWQAGRRSTCHPTVAANACPGGKLASRRKLPSGILAAPCPGAVSRRLLAEFRFGQCTCRKLTRWKPPAFTGLPWLSARQAARPTTTSASPFDDQKKLPEAIAAFHKAIEIDPKYAYGLQQPRHRPS